MAFLVAVILGLTQNPVINLFITTGFQIKSGMTVPHHSSVNCYTSNMQDSIFTQIINSEIPCHKVYEDDQVMAFLDINPITQGHMLVIPKQQIEFIWDMDDELYQHLMAVVKKLGLHARTVMRTEFVGVQVIGVDVPHAHVHVIPFNDISEYHNVPDMSVDPNHGALAAVAKKLAL